MAREKRNYLPTLKILHDLAEQKAEVWAVDHLSEHESEFDEG
jgi:hypothetical protein